MAIYGTALLSLCLISGLVIGKLLGWAVSEFFGLDVGFVPNLGGVGIAMLLLIVFSERLQRVGRLKAPSEQGILFWSSIYIPVVVAMAASQNVLKAIKGGWAAVIAGSLAVLVCFALVPVISRLGRSDERTGD